MATLKDVKAFVKMQDNLDTQALEAKVAAEFSMSHDEAQQMLRGISSEDHDSSTTVPTFLPSAVVALGAGVGGVSQNVGLAAVLNNEITAEPNQTVKDAD